MLVKDPPLNRLAALLDYVSPVVGQVVVVVDDRTKAIGAPIFGDQSAEVVPFTWANDFSSARNVAIDHCTGEWVLILDPDELPTIAMMRHIAAVTETTSSALGWLYFTRNYFGGVQGPEWEEHWHCRLFRRSAGRFYKPVHEQVALNGQPESATRGTAALPKAPREAYLIHAPSPHPEQDAMYSRIASSGWETDLDAVHGGAPE